MTDTPLYAHAYCDNCVFLGRDSSDRFDLYFCPQNGRPTLMARASSQDSDYVAGICFRKSYPELQEAYERAVERGLLEDTHHAK